MGNKGKQKLSKRTRDTLASIVNGIGVWQTISERERFVHGREHSRYILATISMLEYKVQLTTDYGIELPSHDISVRRLDEMRAIRDTMLAEGTWNL